MYLLHISLTFILINCFSCNVIQKLNNANSFSPKINQPIIGTNLTTNTYYCIKDTKGLFLVWDGNVGYGLMTTNVDNCHSSDSYKFEILFEEENDIRLKNKQTDRVLTHYYYTSTTQSFYLTNTTGSDYINKIKLVVKDNGIINIKSFTKSYYLSNSYAFQTNSGYYVILPTAVDKNIANWTFIKASDPLPEEPKLGLSLKVKAFKYESIDKEVVKEYTNQLNIISPLIVDNNSSAKITQEFVSTETVSESWKWNFDQNLTIFGQNITLINKYPKFIRRSLQPINLQKTNYYKQSGYVFETKYNIKKSVDINPDSQLRIESYVDFIEELPIKFTAKGIITAVNSLKGENIASIINRVMNTTIIEILGDSVIINISGELTATYVSNDYFKVIPLGVIY